MTASTTCQRFRGSASTIIASSGILAAYDAVEKSQSGKTSAFVGISDPLKTFEIITSIRPSAFLLILPALTKSGITPSLG